MIVHPSMMGQNRTQMLQQAAQSAAQNVMRRNKMRALIGKTVGGGGGASMGSPIHSMNLGKPIGTAGGISRPGGVIGGGQTLAQQLAAAVGAAQIPGSYNPSGGGADFSSVPDPTDGHQSPQTLPNQGVVPTSAPGYIAPQPVAGTGVPGGYATPPAPAGTPGYAGPPAPTGAPNYTPSPIMGGGATQQVVAPGVVSGTGTPSVGSPGAGVNPGGGMIPLGGNLFYDPVSDTVVGPSGTPGNAGGASRAS